MNRKAITTDRFQRWKKHLKAHDATPLFTLGLTSKDKFVLCTTENMDDVKLLALLEAAVTIQRLRIESN